MENTTCNIVGTSIVMEYAMRNIVGTSIVYEIQPCLGLLEEEGLRGSKHKCGQHFDKTKLSWKVRKTQPSI